MLKCLATLVAFKMIAFAVMDSFMNDQVRTIGESSVTKLTSVRRIPCMYTLVFGDHRPIHEMLVTILALVCCHANVTLFVHNEINHGRIFLAAKLTLGWALTPMHTLNVVREDNAVSEYTTTNFTPVAIGVHTAGNLV